MSDSHWRPYFVKWRLGSAKTGSVLAHKIIARDCADAWERLRKLQQREYPRRKITLIEVKQTSFRGGL